MAAAHAAQRGSFLQERRTFLHTYVVKLVFLGKNFPILVNEEFALYEILYFSFGVHRDGLEHLSKHSLQ